MKKGDLEKAGYPNLSFQPGVLIAVNDDLAYLVDPKKLPFGYSPVGIVKEKTTGNIVGKPMAVTLITFGGNKQVFVIEKNDDLKPSEDYLFQFVYMATEGVEIIEPYGQAWEIFSLPFRTSMFSTFEQKVNQFSDRPFGESPGIESGRELRNMQWIYETQESFSEEELIGESGTFVDIFFENTYRNPNYWLADNDLFWNLFEDHNACEAVIFNGYVHPAKDIRFSQSENQINLFSNVHTTMENILRVAKEYILSNDLCTASEGGETDQPGLGGNNGVELQANSICANYFVEGLGLQTNNGLVFRPDFTDEICNNYTSGIPTEGEFTYGIKFTYQIPVLTKDGLSSLISSEKVKPLQYNIE
jgi:hypothetical protein